MKRVAFILCALCASVANAQFGFHAPQDGRSVGVADWKTSLVGYWPLDSLNQGKAVDASGNGNVGVAVSNVVPGIGVISCSSILNPNNFISLPNGVQTNFSSGKLSVCAWVNLKSVSDVYGGTIFKNWGDTIAGAIHFDISSGTPRLYVSQSGGTVIGPVTQNAISANVWYHLVAVANGTSIIIYLNSVSGTPAGYNGTLNTSFAYNKIGAKSSDTGGTSPAGAGWLNGSIDDVRIYNRALTSNEISAIYRWGWGQHQGTPTHP